MTPHPTAGRPMPPSLAPPFSLTLFPPIFPSSLPPLPSSHPPSLPSIPLLHLPSSVPHPLPPTLPPTLPYPSLRSVHPPIPRQCICSIPEHDPAVPGVVLGGVKVCVVPNTHGQMQLNIGLWVPEVQVGSGLEFKDMMGLAGRGGKSGGRERGCWRKAHARSEVQTADDHQGQASCPTAPVAADRRQQYCCTPLASATALTPALVRRGRHPHQQHHDGQHHQALLLQQHPPRTGWQLP